jgi:membrane-associated PAP2 superfamily phosphatase
MPVRSRQHVPELFVPTALTLAALIAWDLSGFDLALAAAMGSPNGFPLREHWLLTAVMHDGVRRGSWTLVLGLSLGVWWPFGPLARLDFSKRLQLATTSIAAATLVSAFKGFSTASCPWDLAAFGGVAHYLPHWSFAADGGPGHCFPAGHASSGFAFAGGFFAFRDGSPRLARAWLAAALAAGVILGVGQQLRGAHFMSHTLWTGWICWTVAWAADRAWPRRLQEQS